MSSVALEQSLQKVPFLATLGVRVEETQTGHLVLRLPFNDTLTNHAGTLHTATVFAIGELAAAVVLATHPDLAGHHHLQKSTKIKYYIPAGKDITAHVSLTPEMIERITSGSGQTSLELPVKVLDGHGNDVAELSCNFAFRPR